MNTEYIIFVIILLLLIYYLYNNIIYKKQNVILSRNINTNKLNDNFPNLFSNVNEENVDTNNIYEILFVKNNNCSSQLTNKDKQNMIKKENEFEEISDFVYNNNCNCCDKNTVDEIKSFNNLTYFDKCCNTNTETDNCLEEKSKLKLNKNNQYYIEFIDNNVVECYTSYGCDNCYITFDYTLGFIPNNIQTDNKDVNIYLLYGEGKTNCSKQILLSEQDLNNLYDVISSIYTINKHTSIKGIKISKK
jgi:hypothetical protein